MPEFLSGNRGEWSEIYIFLSLMSDGRIYAADSGMNRIDTVFLNILKIIREEVRNQRYDYHTGDTVRIVLNDGAVVKEVPVSEFRHNKDILWTLLSGTTRGNYLTSPEVQTFLESVYIHKLKAPAVSNAEYFGGTQDITMQVQDYRSGVTSVIGFSCKSDFSAKSTLFNASKENTNFIYEVVGDRMNDDLMERFNDTFTYRNKVNKETGVVERKAVVAIIDRMRLLKEADCDLRYVGMPIASAKRNLVTSGGNEMPSIVADMLKFYYFVNEGKAEHSSIEDALEYIIADNPADYEFDEIDSMYRGKVGTLLYHMFTGMRLSSPWNARSSVNGGYIVSKRDGEVLAYHSCMADEFKDFLIHQLGFESPSASRHQYMSIYKEDGRYYIKLNLQVRFKGVQGDDNAEED